MTELNVNYLWLIPLFPLLGAIINGAVTTAATITGGKPNRTLVNVIACLMPALSFIVVCIGYFGLKAHSDSVLTQTLFTWMSVRISEGSSSRK